MLIQHNAHVYENTFGQQAWMLLHLLHVPLHIVNVDKWSHASIKCIYSYITIVVVVVSDMSDCE